MDKPFITKLTTIEEGINLITHSTTQIGLDSVPYWCHTSFIDYQNGYTKIRSNFSDLEIQSYYDVQKWLNIYNRLDSYIVIVTEVFNQYTINEHLASVSAYLNYENIEDILRNINDTLLNYMKDFYIGDLTDEIEELNLE